MHLCMLAVHIISAKNKHAVTSIKQFSGFPSLDVRVLNLVPTESCFISVTADLAKHAGGPPHSEAVTVLIPSTSTHEGTHEFG